MKVRVLGCSGAIAKDCRTTSFLIDGDVLVDAGTGVGMALAEMKAVGHVLLTHSHLDHVAALPRDRRHRSQRPAVKVYALSGTIAALKAHMLNNVIGGLQPHPDPRIPVHQLSRKSRSSRPWTSPAS